MQELWNKLTELGLYTKSFEEFQNKYNNVDGVNTLHSTLSDMGLYTKSEDEFISQYGFDIPKQTEEKVDDGSGPTIDAEWEAIKSSLIPTGEAAEEDEVTEEPVVWQGEEIAVADPNYYGGAFEGATSTEDLFEVTDEEEVSISETAQSTYDSYTQLEDDHSNITDQDRANEAQLKKEYGEYLKNKGGYKDTGQKTLSYEKWVENKIKLVNSGVYDNMPEKITPAIQWAVNKGFEGLPSQLDTNYEANKNNYFNQKLTIAKRRWLKETGYDLESAEGKALLEKLDTVTLADIEADRIGTAGSGTRTLATIFNSISNDDPQFKQAILNTESRAARNEVIRGKASDMANELDVSGTAQEGASIFGALFFDQSREQVDITEGAKSDLWNIEEAARKKSLEANVVHEQYNRVYDNITNIQLELKEIGDPKAKVEEIKAKHDLNTKEGVDAANKEITEFVQGYESLINRYNNASATLQDIVLAATQINDEISELSIREQDLDAFTDQIGKNHRLATQMANAFGQATIDLVEGAADFVYMVNPLGALADELLEYAGDDSILGAVVGTARIMTGPISWYSGETRDKVKDAVNGYQEHVNSMVAEPPRYEDINSVGSAIEWALVAGATQAPQLALLAATGGTAGLIMMGATSAGQKFSAMEDQRELFRKTGGLYGLDHNFATMYAASLASGSIEALSERVTLGLMKGTGGIATNALFKQQGKDVASTFFRRQVFGGEKLKYASKKLIDIAEEGGSEALATIGGNYIDRLAGDKTVNLLSGVEESFVTGALIGSTLSMPTIFRDVHSSFKSVEASEVLDANYEKILEQNAIMNRTKEGSPEWNAAFELNQMLVAQNAEAIAIDIKRVDSLSPEEKVKLVELEVENRKLVEQAKEIAQSDMSKEDQEKQGQALADAYNRNLQEKNNIIAQYPADEVLRAHELEIERLQAQSDAIEAEGGAAINVTRAKSTTDEGLVVEFDEWVKQAEKKGNVRIAASEDGTQVYGAMAPVLNDAGEVVSYEMFFNEKNILEDGQTATASHELFHAAIFNTIRANPVKRRRFGEAIERILDGPGVTINEEARRDLERVKQYSKTSRGEEIFAIVSEQMVKGNITIDAGAVGRLKDLVRRTSMSMTDTDIQFNDDNDVRNFLKDYSRSRRKGVEDKRITSLFVQGAKGKMAEAPTTREEARKIVEERLEEEGEIQFSQAKDELAGLGKRMDDTLLKKDGKRITNQDEYRASQGFEDMWKIIAFDEQVGNMIVKRARTMKNPVPEKVLTNQVLRNKFIQRVRDDLGLKFGSEFDPKKNDSVFGWMTGKNPALKYSILNVKKEAAQDPIADGVSLDSEMGDSGGGSYADLVEAETDAFMQQLEEADAAKTQEQLEADKPKKVVDELNISKEGKASIKQTIIDADLNLKGIKYKDVKKLTTGKDAPLSNVLNVIAEKFGVDPKRIVKPSDLNSKQRTAAQNFINNNAEFLLEMLPEGETVSGEATGVANTKLGELYKKGERLKFKSGATAAGKFSQQKRSDVTIEQFKELFGIKPDGTFDNNRKHDGAIKALVNQATVLAGNQALRESAIESGEFSEAVVAALGEGRAETMFSKRPMEYSPKDQSIMADYVRKYGTSEGEMLKVLHPEITEVVEDFAITNILQVDAGGYNSQVFNDKNTPEGLKDLFELRGKKQVIYRGPRLFDVADNGKGILNKTGKTYAKQVSNIGATFHPNVDSEMLLPILGIKNSGKYDGDTWSTRSIHPDAIPREAGKIKGRSLSKSQIAAEEKLMKENGINPADLKLAKPMIMKDRVADIIYEIHAQPTLELKKQKLEEHRPELENINRGNRALLKYTVLKLEQASRQGNLDPVTMYHLGAMQTNIIEGLRSLSTFEYIYLTEGKQYPVVKGVRSGKFTLLKRPALKGRSVKEFLESDDWSNYNKEWEDTVDYNETYSANINSPQVKSYAERTGVSIELAAQDITIKELVIKNEHVGASATTNAEINVFVNSAGANMNINDIGNHHRSFFGPKFLMNRYLDAKIPINGMLVDNKVSFEGDLRLTKFAGKRRNDIFHVSGVDVSQYVVENKDAIEEVRNKYIPEINDRVRILEPMQGAMSMSKRAPKPKGISVLDFDDTLATTKSNILYTAPDGTTGKLNAEEFAKRGSTLLAQGYKFDFSEFNKVVDGKTAPLFNKAIKLSKKFGTDNMFILTARAPESQVAIKEFLDSQGLNIPIENITGLGNSTAEAKALWIAGKVREGYNDFYFADDAIQNVDAVKAMLDQFDVKSKVQQAKVEFSKRAPKEMENIINEKQDDLDSDFNTMLEESRGIGKQKRFSKAKARQRGKNKGKFKFFIPPSADDFAGLMYYFMGKGKTGDKHHKWFKENLFDPFSKGIRHLNGVKQAVANDLKQLRSAMPEVRKKLGKKLKNTEYTHADAIRIYNWDRAGFDVPGLSETDKKTIIREINADAQLKAFADGVNSIGNMPGGIVEPGEHWLGGTIASDMTDALENARATFLQPWKDNIDIIFNEANLNKIEAEYGSNFREALEDILFRMEHGGNRSRGAGRLLNNFTSWIHGSIGTTMFFNARSAVLQMISNVNFINWSDNNVLQAASAFANQPQYWKDVVMIFNSPFLKQRRAGLQTDVNAAELLAQIKDSKNKLKAATAYLLQLGFTPTQIADSLAIATGGATMYRNRIKTYAKEGMSKKEAESRAFKDMMEIAEETQQSAREDRISQQQASPLGKFILAFQNTPMQYNRLIKKAAMDLVNGRGDWRSNVSKIVYYGAIQNMIFYGLQQALFAAMFGDDEEDELTDKKKERVINGMMDTLLRGAGIGGAVVSTIKNVVLKFMSESEKMDDTTTRLNKDGEVILDPATGQPKQYDNFFTDPDWGNVVIEALNISPPIGIKARKIYSGLKTWEYNKDVIDHMSKTDLDNPIYDAVFSGTEAITNLPLSRLYNKYQNVSEAMDSDHETWKRVAMLLGWSKWNFGIKNQDVMTAKNELKEIKEKEKEEKKEQNKRDREMQKLAEEEVEIENNLLDQDEQREQGAEEVQCAAVSRSGKRCSNMALPGKNFCTIHESVPQQQEEVQCSHIKDNGKRCKMKTKNKSGKCYYHD